MASSGSALGSGLSFITPTLGVTYLGTIASAILYGVTNVQTYLYYKRNKDDPRVLKMIVSILWVLDSLHQAFITHAFYTYSVTDFDNPVALIAPEWSVMAHVFVASTSDTIVRGLFCQRVYLLSGRNWLITTLIAVTSLGVFASSWAFAIKGLSLTDYFDLTKITWFIYTSLILSVVSDLLIAGSLCVLLSQRRSGFARTNSAIRMLMVYSINTGALTSICAIVCLTIYAAMPNETKFTFIAIYFVLPKLLLNSLLATLNARHSLRERTHTGPNLSFPMTRPSGSTGTGTGSKFSNKTGDRRSSNGQAIQVEIQTVTDSKLGTAIQTAEETESWHAV